MEKKRQIAVVVLVILIVVTGVYWVYGKYMTTDRDLIEATGTIEATTVSLNTKLAGTIKKINVNTGDSVKNGQILAELSRNDIIAQFKRDEHSVMKAEAYLKDMLSGARVQEMNEAAANVEIVRAEYKKAKDDLERVHTLFEAGAVSEIEYENAFLAIEIGQNKLAAAEARLSLLEEGSRPEQVEAARLEVERNNAVLMATKATLEDLRLYSPIEGVVISKNYEEGEFVQMGAPLLTLADIENLWIKVYIPTDDLPAVKLGQTVSFSVSGLSQSYEGTVKEIATKGEFTPKTIQTKKERTNVVFGVKISISSEGGILKPGMPADVTFLRGQ